MRLESHINMALHTLTKIQYEVDWKINKTAFILGCIAPDLNMIFPKHTINMTIKKWYKHLSNITKSTSDIIKSFRLGIITHYICDYFCLVHNIKSHGPRHILYERLLNKQIRLRKNTPITTEDEMNFKWDTAIKEIINKTNPLENLKGLLINMNKLYMNETELIKGKRWYRNIERTLIDIKYAQFMCTKIASEIISM